MDNKVDRIVSSTIIYDRYEVVDANSIIAFNFDSPIDIIEEFNNSFKLTIRIIQKIDKTGERKLLSRVEEENNLVEFISYNFNTSLGTGTINPIEICTIGNKKVYIHFWIYMLGGEDGRSSKIEYTIWKEK